MNRVDFLNLKNSTWCPGCANFNLQAALVQALMNLRLKPHQLAMVFDIGCVGNACSIWKTYAFHTIHGRTAPMAIGAKLANNKLTVIGIAGDGGVYGEGIGHLIEAARANFNITLIVGNNLLYSLTKGQASPTIEQGTKTKSTPDGVLKTALNPLTLALSAGASFTARGYTGEIAHLTEVFKQAITHSGFSLVDVLQPCIALDKKHTRQWYEQRIYKLDKSWPVQNKQKAMVKTEENNKKIPIGIFFQEKRPTYQEQIPFLKRNPLVSQPRIKRADFQKLVTEFK